MTSVKHVKIHDPQQIKLIDYLAQQEGLSSDDISTLLRSIEAHDLLTAFRTVSQNLPRVLPWLVTIDPKVWSQEKIDLWVTICRAIEAHHETLQKLIPDFGTVNDERKNGPLHGSIKDYPLYCALWTNPGKGVRKEAFYYLQALFIHAQECFRIYNAKLDKSYKSVVTGSSRLIRQLGHRRKLVSNFNDFPSDLLPIDHFHLSIKAILDRPEFADNDLLVIIERLAAYSLGLRGGYTRTRSKNLRPALVTKVQQGDPLDESLPGITIRHSSLESEEADEAYAQGCAPDEACAGPQFFAQDEFIQEDGGLSLVAKIMQTKNLHRHLACANQQLPPRWDRINYQDTSQFFTGIKHLIEGKHPDITKDRENGNFALAGLLAIMYWTSSLYDRAIKTRICHTVDQFPKSIDPNTIYIACKDQILALAPPELNQRRKASATWQLYLEPVAKFITLPMGSLFQQQASNWLDIVSKEIKKRSIRLFPERGQDLKAAIKDFLKKINSTSKTRLTEKRIASHMIQLTGDQSQDSADAAFIFGRYPPAGQRTSLYYYAPQITLLQATYKDVCEKIEKAFPHIEIKDNLKLETPHDSNKSILTKCDRIGSEICPRKETVALLVSDLKAMVAYHRKSRMPNQAIIDYHNAFTSYCVMLVGFATGYRAVRDPFYSISEIDFETGFAAIADKDSNDQYNARLVWLPKVCQDQIRNYETHRNALADHLIFTNQDLAKEIISANQTQLSDWGRRKKGDQGENSDTKHSPFFFYLNNKWAPVKVKPSSLQDSIKWTYDLPLNSNRHYLRTHLREEQVPGEIVDAFLGHWDRGKEPFGRYSSLSPHQFRKALEIPLTKLLAEAGWKAIRGLR